MRSYRILVSMYYKQYSIQMRRSFLRTIYFWQPIDANFVYICVYIIGIQHSKKVWCFSITRSHVFALFVDCHCTMHFQDCMYRCIPNQAPILLTWININPAWISNCSHYEVWDEITCPFQNFNGCIVVVWGWKSNFISQFTENVIDYPCWDYG